MPFGISNIMNPKYPKIESRDQLSQLIDDYFIFIKGEKAPTVERTRKTAPKTATATASATSSAATKKPTWLREPEPPTITGLALFLGFDSLQIFEDYEKKGKFGAALKRGRLQIEAVYEKKLHQQAPAGAIFVLKTMGWQDKADAKAASTPTVRTMKILIIETGPTPVSTEKEVVLE
jgi:hypothetical protein